MSQKLGQTPKATHSSSGAILLKEATANTTTSVSPSHNPSAQHLPHAEASTRQKRGKAVRNGVAPLNVMPNTCKDFLRCDENKTALFSFLTREAICLPVAQGNELYATYGTGVLCSPADSCVAFLSPCLREEADTQLLLHVVDAVQKGCKKVTIRTVDKDVVVLAVGFLWCWAELLINCYSPSCCHNDSCQVTDSLSLTLSLGVSVTLLLHLLAEDRRQPGRHGSLSQRSLILCRNSWPCQVRSVKD